MYADDLQLYIGTKISDIQKCVSDINYDLNQVYNWAKNNKLCINPSKSKLLVIHRRKLTVLDNLIVHLSNTSIPRVETACNLGLTFNCNLTWTNHISKTLGKVYGMLPNLWAVRLSTPFQIRMLLAKSYLIPTLLYGCEVFYNCDFEDNRRLTVAFNDITRYIFNRKRHESISQFALQVFNVSFKNYLNIRSLILLHKIIQTKEPGHLFAHLKFARSNRGLKIIPPRINCLNSERQFFIATIRLWNNLPSNIQRISNFTTFRKELFSFFQ